MASSSAIDKEGEAASGNSNNSPFRPHRQKSSSFCFNGKEVNARY